MADKAKHAYGSRKKLDAAIASGAVDAYDVLFLNGEDEAPAIGWVDKNGKPVVISPTDDLAKLESQIETELATKASSESVAVLEAEMTTKANAKDVETLESQMATKVDASTVQSMINEAAVGVIEVVEF